MSPGRAAFTKWAVAIALGLAVSALTLATALMLRQGLHKADQWASVVGGYLAAITLLITGFSWLGPRLWHRATTPGGASADTTPARAFGGASLVPPTADLPPRMRGRDHIARRLRKAARRPTGGVWILTGLGGVGKSTIAVEMCRWSAGRARPVWWISANDVRDLTEGMIGLASALGADQVHLLALRAQAPRARERLWELLGNSPPGWLLVFDNVDDPQVMRILRDSDLKRCGARGLVLITTRINQRELSGPDAELNEIGPLGEEDAARVLMDMAPAAGDRAAATRLAQSLGCLPLALHLAGSNLGSPLAMWPSFDGYRKALGELGLDRVLTAAQRIGQEPDHRRNVLLTWEMSLSALADHGLPQSGPLLRLLSLYSPTVPIPERLLHPDPIRPLIGLDDSTDALDVRRRVHEGLAGLADQSLVVIRDVPGPPSVRERMITLHPIVAETNRLRVNGGGRTGPPPPEQAMLLPTAVTLAAASVAPLRFDDNRDWPRFGMLAPHIEELLGFAETVDHAHLATLLTTIAGLVAFRTWAGFETAAETLADRALARGKPLGRAHPAVLHLRNERAWAVGRLDRWSEARAELQQVGDARRRCLGSAHPDTLDTRHKLAWAAGRLGDWPAAEAQLRPVLETRTETLGGEHPDTLHTRCCLAWAVGARGRLEEAEATYHDVIATRQRVLGKDHVETLDARHSLAELYVMYGRFRDAERIIDALVRDRLRLLGAGHPETLDSRPRYWLARALHGQGRHREANRLLRQLLEDQIRYLDQHHPAVRATRNLLHHNHGPYQDW